MTVKTALRAAILLLVVMPILGVGVVYWTTSAQKERERSAVEERARMEEQRRSELEAEARAKASSRSALPRPQLKQSLEDGE